MRESLKSWITYLEAQDYAPNTVDLYRVFVTELLDFVGKPTVTADDIERWMIHHKNWSPVTRKSHFVAVKSFFRYLLNKKLIADDPSTILPAVKLNRRVDESAMRGKEDRVYTPDQLVALIEFDDIRFKSQVRRDKAMIALMAGTGMRASEIAWLNLGQIRHRDGNTIFALRKGQSVRKIHVAEFVWPYIDDYLLDRVRDGDDAPLFVTRNGNRFDRHVVYDILRVRQEAMNLRTGAHNIRYTVINAIERYANPVVARDIAGQKSIAITNNYLVSSEDERTDAMAALPWAEKIFSGSKKKENP